MMSLYAPASFWEEAQTRAATSMTEPMRSTSLLEESHKRGINGRSYGACLDSENAACGVTQLEFKLVVNPNPNPWHNRSPPN